MLEYDSSVAHAPVVDAVAADAATEKKGTPMHDPRTALSSPLSRMPGLLRHPVSSQGLNS
jgi:hypothetical protein